MPQALNHQIPSRAAFGPNPRCTTFSPQALFVRLLGTSFVVALLPCVWRLVSTDLGLLEEGYCKSQPDLFKLVSSGIKAHHSQTTETLHQYDTCRISIVGDTDGAHSCLVDHSR